MNTTVRQGALRPAEDIVCHCANVGRAAIMAAIETVGTDVDAIQRLTGAGSVCGGCTPLIGQVVGQDTMRRAQIVEKEQLDDHHWRLVLQVSGGLDPNNAGQDIALEVPLGARGHVRSYTVTRAEGDRLEIAIRREPNGLISRWLCDTAGPEHFLRVSARFGEIGIEPTQQIVFLAAGIGITPALAFLRANPDQDARVYWWHRSTEAPGLRAHVLNAFAGSSAKVTLLDTSAEDKRLGDAATEWLRARLTPGRDVPHLCGPQGFLDIAAQALDAIGWPQDARKVASFVYAPGQGVAASSAPLHKIESFRIPQDATETPSFHLRPAKSMIPRLREARGFLQQFYHEIGAERPFEDRLAEITKELRQEGSYRQTYDELAYGARLAWRNSNRCIGRFFWQSLTVRDRRDLDDHRDDAALAQAVFNELVAHIAFGTNDGDLRPSITVFPSDRGIFIENGQLILYAGYEQTDGSILGDPKNVTLTKRAQSLGWRGAGTRFDVLPVLIAINGGTPHLFELPSDVVTEVPLSHPDCEDVAALGLRWFALPAVANMALDLGGIVYSAAPSNGFYMGTEIGSFNLADPRRYDQLPAIAGALALDTAVTNPLWRDQALLELNRAVMYSFSQAGVRILDHHALSVWFDRFRADETEKGRPVFGHWPWIVPPMSGNLSNVWHDATLKNVILKPGYFYQRARDVPSQGHR